MKDVNLADDSWKRIAEATGIKSPKIKEKANKVAASEAQLAEEKVEELLTLIYTELERMPEGTEALVLKRIVEDLALSPAFQLVTAEKNSA